MPEFRQRSGGAQDIEFRLRVAAVLMVAVLGILAGRLWQLQMIEGKIYSAKSERNRIRLVRIPAARGKILDSAGRVLAENVPGFSLEMAPGALDDPLEVIDACSSPLGIPPERFRKLIEKGRSSPRYMTFPLKKNMSLEEVSLVKSSITDVKGVVLEAKPIRRYPFGETLCHVIGNLGEVSASELQKNARLGYQPGDLIGKSGIEKEYESYLKGVEGWERIGIDAMGRQLSDVTVRPPKRGSDIVLTVDASLQRFVEEIFLHRAGSVVAVDPDSGRILAMVSKPGFDLNLFAPSISERQWRTLNSDPLHPLENRSIRGLYSPASAFKVVVAAAALAEYAVTGRDTFTCDGVMELGGRKFRCWKRDGHGKVSMTRAIAESCDIYFYRLGLKLGPDLMARYASMFGFGKPTGLGLPQELPGLIPTPEWKRRVYGRPWRDGETVTFAIGQGYFVSTPIQLAMMTAAFANGGILMRPAIVQEIRGPDGAPTFVRHPAEIGRIDLEPDDWSLLKSAMIDVVSGKHGTGKYARIPGLQVAGKTGTSQVIRHRDRTDDKDQVPYHERAHAIFTCFVDDRPKRLALVVIVEHGGSGGKTAAPLARRIICRYYGVPDPGDPE